MKRQWFRISNEAARPRVDIYGDIGSSWWDDDAVSAAEFIEAIKPFALQPIDLHINSGGGDVFDGVAIHTAIAQRSPETVCYIDGLAASAATLPAMACNRIVIANGALMMVHRASTALWGNSGDLRAMADTLDKIDSSLCDIYGRRTGIDAEDLMAMLVETTWMKADEAVEKGFADEVDGEVLKAAACVGKRIVDSYRNAPESLGDLLAAAEEGSRESDTGEIIPKSDPDPKAPGAEGAEVSETEAQEGRPIVALHSGVYSFEGE